MLKKLEPEQFEQYIDFAYELAMDLSKASFPIYADGVKTKDFFINQSKKGLEHENEEILLFEQDGIVEGWIHYFFIKEDNYIGPNNILVRTGYAEALNELLLYWKEHFPGYKWHTYFPQENQKALSFMEEKGYVCKERQVVDVLLFDNYTPRVESKNVISINKENFEIFRQLHRYLDDKMYWSSDRIFQTIEQWQIYAYMDQGTCLSTLYHNGKGKADLEIFGIDSNNSACESKVIEALLISCLNKAKQNKANSMYFFNDEQTHKITKELGFTCATVAHYFSK